MQRRSILALIVVVFAGCESSVDPPAFHSYRVGLTIDGYARIYEWSEPDGAESAPVILVLHGAQGTAEEMRRNTGMSEAGTREGYVVVYGQAAAERNRVWSTGCSTCDPGDPRTIDDARYVDAILADLAIHTSIDASRIFVAGFSNGGTLAYNLACRRSDLVHAIVTVGALLQRSQAAQCLPQRPIGTLVIYGELDTTQPLNGSSTHFSVDSSAIFWSELAGCSVSSGPTERRFGSMTARVLERTGCDGNVRVEAHVVANFGHDWPYGGYDATTEALRVFAAR